MATEPILAGLDIAAVQRRHGFARLENQFRYRRICGGFSGAGCRDRRRDRILSANKNSERISAADAKKSC